MFVRGHFIKNKNVADAQSVETHRASNICSLMFLMTEKVLWNILHFTLSKKKKSLVLHLKTVFKILLVQFIDLQMR